MNDLPRPARFFILLVFVLGVGAAILSVPAVLREPTFGLTILFLALTIAALDFYPVSLYSTQKNNVEVTISIAVKMAAILLFPPPVVILSVFLGTLLAELLLKRVWYRLIFNVGMMTIGFALDAVLFNRLFDPGVPLFGSAQNVFALVALGLSDFAINSILVSLVISLATRTAISYVWVQNYKQLILHELSMLPLGIFIYILWEYTPWSVILIALPLFIVRHSYQLVAELGRQTRQALYALARVLDERDPHTSRHSELVAEHAGLIARTLGLGPEQVDIIEKAAVLHDIGKVGMRNDILFKTGALTVEERESAKRHAVIGGDLLKMFPSFEKGADYVRHHHERWNGSGYPDGLRGEEIPLGARILAVADAYQAMIEERPYRKPLSPEEAYANLRQDAGVLFDPQVVAAFFKAKGVEFNPVGEHHVIAPQPVVSLPERR
jgi:putative nucleotidyltransferase with HDIG domain